MKNNIFVTTLFSAVIVCLNFPGLFDSYMDPAQIVAATITILLILIIWQVYLYHTLSHKKAERQNPVPDTPKDTANTSDLPPYEHGCNLDHFLQKIFEAYDKSESIDKKPNDKDKDSLRDELDSYRQSYLWCIKMQQRYGDSWTECFQGASLPIREEDYPKMRSLIAEVALQTIDYCRYRAGSINLTERMMVNPKMILLDLLAEQAGASAISDDPFQIPKEALALQELFKQDKITLQHASIHGFTCNIN